MGANASRTSSAHHQAPPTLRRQESLTDLLRTLAKRPKPLNRDFMNELPNSVAKNIAAFLDFREHNVLRRVNHYWNHFFNSLAQKHHEQQMESLFLSLTM